MNEREFRVWVAVIAAVANKEGWLIPEAAREADMAVEEYRKRQREAMAKQYVPPAPFV